MILLLLLTVVDNGATPIDEANSYTVISARAIASCKIILIAFLNSTLSNFKGEYRVLKYTVFDNAGDADNNAYADAVVTKVADYNATASGYENGDDYYDAIVATEAIVEYVSNTVVTVVVGYNAKFGHDRKIKYVLEMKKRGTHF